MIFISENRTYFLFIFNNIFSLFNFNRNKNVLKEPHRNDSNPDPCMRKLMLNHSNSEQTNLGDIGSFLTGLVG